MLTYAFGELQMKHYEDISGEDFDEIDDLFAEILIKGISFQLKKGLHRVYVVHKESLMALRGKLDMEGTLMNRMQKTRRVACEYDELSENNLFNQIVKSTALLLLKGAHVTTDKKNRLKRLLLYLGGVDVVNVKCVRWNTLTFDRNNGTYHLLLNICYFVVEGMLMTTEKGEHTMRTLSDKHMCKLFEKFVLRYYQKHHPELRAKAAKIELNIDEKESSIEMLPQLQTDIMLRKPNRKLIIDTKYYGQVWQEHYSKKTIHSANYNQIFMYVMNEDKGHEGNVDGMLLYAKTGDDVVPDGKVLHNDGNMFYFKTLDLNVDFDHIKEQLDGFVALF